MANYRKSFNLRSGVQVDDDNFIVNTNGLVGIGTSIPREFLDVRGNAQIVGLVTANSLYAGIATIRSLNISQSLVSSGIITATSFSGSASGLTGIYAIAVDGWYVTAGTISTTSKVGIGTTIVNGQLQIGTGITFNSNGNTSYSGIVTASQFNGLLNASNLTGTIDNSRLPSSINISGIITASSGFVGNITGTASTASSLTGSPNISVGTVSATTISVGIITAPTAAIGLMTAGIATVFTTLHVGTSGTVFSASNGNIGIGTAIPTQKLTLVGGNIGILSSTSEPYIILGNKIGVGTFLPDSDVHIRRSSISSLLITSDTAESTISVGRSTSGTNNSGALRFGNTSSITFPYSTQKSLDIINYDTGNVNFYIEGGTVGVNTGSFYWLRRGNFDQLMTLTYDKKLGLGITNPTSTLHVVGTSTVTNNAYFGNNVEIKNNLTTNGTTTLNSLTANVGTITTLTSTNATIDTIEGININASGTVQATNGFSCGSGQLTFVVTGSQLTITVPGVGSTTLTLS